MKSVSQVGVAQTEEKTNANFAVDTTFVLFFLALELGQSFRGFTLDGIFLLLTLLMVAVLPYFLPADDKPNVWNWLFGRGAITFFAILLGFMFRQSLGVALPETFRFLPMTLLITAAMLSVYIQFYSFLKFRFVK